MMINVKEFWNLIHKYDVAIFPMQYIFSLIAIVLLMLMAKKPGDKLTKWFNLFLASCYLWIGIVFYLIYNSELSAKMHYFQPGLMFLIAFFFLLDIFLKRSEFKFSQNSWHNGFALFFMTYSIIGYPIVGWLLGHPYSAPISGTFSVWIPILGVYPCPTTIFSLSLLSLALPKGDKYCSGHFSLFLGRPCACMESMRI